jgi:hypothetical protein
MRARLLFGGLLAMSTVVIAEPASAKASIAEASIAGPGLDGGITLEHPNTDGLWKSGIDVTGGTDNVRADVVEELGLAPADLGPTYVVTYRFHDDVLVRQDLYPYAEGGPVTYTPPGQEITVGITMQITSGWYRSSHTFFEYLIDHGLPSANPIAAEAGPAASRPQSVPWVGILGLGGLSAILSLVALAKRRRLFPGTLPTSDPTTSA